MAKRRFGIIISLLCLCLYMLPCAALAASTTEAKELIDTQRECSLEISYCYDETAFPDQTVKLYKVGEVSSEFQYSLAAPFAGSGLVLNGIQTEGEWNVIRSTLEAEILADGVEELASAITDENGKASFDSLDPGLYLVSAVQVVQGNRTCIFDSALISLPGLGSDGCWQYQVSVAAKPEILPPIEPDEKIELKVLKLWRGDEGKNSRPQSVEVEIFKDGISCEKVTLSAENNWSYSWSAKSETEDWKVVERNVPTGYTMTVEKRGTSFVITNTYLDTSTPTPPKTGDTSNIYLYVALLCACVGMLIVLVIVRKRMRDEEKR